MLPWGTQAFHTDERIRGSSIFVVPFDKALRSELCRIRNRQELEPAAVCIPSAMDWTLPRAPSGSRLFSGRPPASAASACLRRPLPPRMRARWRAASPGPRRAPPRPGRHSRARNEHAYACANRQPAAACPCAFARPACAPGVSARRARSGAHFVFRARSALGFFSSPLATDEGCVFFSFVFLFSLRPWASVRRRLAGTRSVTPSCSAPARVASCERAFAFESRGFSPSRCCSLAEIPR